MDMRIFQWEHCLQVLAASSFPITVASDTTGTVTNLCGGGEVIDCIIASDFSGS